MHPRTAATLEKLERAEWFYRVGVKDAEAAVVLSSWSEAVEHCSSPEWENLCLEAANQYRERLVERSVERFERWNEVVDNVKPAAMALAHRKIAPVASEYSLPKAFVDAVEWDMIHVCMEAEYADVYPPGFFASQAYWYVKGHFPCGWRGEFPQGTLIIY